jgi:hypothetical protein
MLGGMKKCNIDYSQNGQDENATESMRMSVFIVHFGGAF